MPERILSEFCVDGSGTAQYRIRLDTDGRWITEEWIAHEHLPSWVKAATHHSEAAAIEWLKLRYHSV